LRQAEQLGAGAWLSFTKYGLGQAYFLAGRYRDAERLLEGACTRLINAPAEVPAGITGASLLVLCCMMKAVSHAAMGELDRADFYERHATEIASANNRPYDRIAAGYSHGVVRLLHGDAEGASKALSDALELSRRNEVHQFVPVVMCQLGNSYLQQGRPQDAREVLEEAKSEAATLGHTASVALASIYLALALSSLGNTTEAIGLAKNAQTTAKQQGYEWVAAQALFAEATILTSKPQGDILEAKGSLYAALEIAARIEAKPLLAIGKTLLARLLNREGNASGAATQFHQAIALFAEMKMTRQLERVTAAFSASRKS
jgi:tetratricopeptide (TPR) repeat protein